MCHELSPSTQRPPVRDCVVICKKYRGGAVKAEHSESVSGLAQKFFCAPRMKTRISTVRLPRYLCREARRASPPATDQFLDVQRREASFFLQRRRRDVHSNDESPATRGKAGHRTHTRRRSDLFASLVLLARARTCAQYDTRRCHYSLALVASIIPRRNRRFKAPVIEDNARSDDLFSRRVIRISRA